MPTSSYNSHRGTLGLALLVNPHCNLPIYHISHDHPLLAKYSLSIILSSKILIHCLYLPPSLETEDVSQILDSLPLHISNTNTTIICGDFNARMGDFTGDTRTNATGRRLLNWITANNLILWNKRLAYGEPTSYTFQGTSIIDFFFSNCEFTMPTLTIRDDLSLNSNHKFMTLSFNLPDYPTGLPPPQRITWNVGKLKHPETRKNYKDVFEQNLSLILPPHSSISFLDRSAACQYIDTVHDDLCKAIISTLDSVCARRTNQTEDYLKDFWTPEMTAAFKRKEHLYKKWRKARGLNCLRYWEQHQEAQAALRRLVSNRRKETWRIFCQRLAQGDYTKAIAKFSKIRKNRKIKASFSTTEGPQHSADVMARHLEQLFSGDLLPSRPTPPTNCAQPFDVSSCPIDIDSINAAIKQLPRQKAPGIDHITIEMLSPLTDTLTPVLLYLFRLCWQWSYTPLTWRVAQVIPIHKKGSVSDPGNFRPISLTSTFRKILEKCLYPTLEGESPDLDIAQGGFRSSRSTLDQALCLIETCSILRRKHKITPTLAFLDIKSAYDTVDREHIWNTLQPTASPALLGLLRNLFDDAHIEVIVSNASSYRFSPTTGVLQGSILSPFLYSLYINELPSLLRRQALDAALTTNVCQFTKSINCLLYADDVVLIADSPDLEVLLQQCEAHSQRLGYRWNPSKCAILAPGSDTRSYSLYGTVLPRQTSFSYLGIPISPGGYLNTNELVQNNINKALQTMNQMSAIGVNHKGFNQLLSVRFYTQIVRSQLEYGLAISAVSSSNITKLETCQTQCIRRIFGGGSRSSTKVMLHLTNQPTMKERVHRLQAKFLFRSINAPEDTLLSQFLEYLRTSASLSQWYKLSKTPLWQRCCASHEIDALDSRTFNTIYHDYLKDNFNARRNTTNSFLLSTCRAKPGVDPILWLPMTPAERSRLIRWRLGWLPAHPITCYLVPAYASSFTNARK
ncbi:hypothetical protein G6F62_006643 [Rhizopus arrhizus]|nr:hypothetical protein G6F62_006643 [Rhizopus arrhizus]KAG1374671.1 hypothetical protein G6F61_009126 [Rhizopus arrhizus]